MVASNTRLEIRGLDRRAFGELSRQARRLGLTPARYARQLVEEKLEIEREARLKTFAEIAGPGREVDEEELDRLVEEAKARHHRREMGKKR